MTEGCDLAMEVWRRGRHRSICECVELRAHGRVVHASANCPSSAPRRLRRTWTMWHARVLHRKADRLAIPRERLRRDGARPGSSGGQSRNQIVVGSDADGTLDRTVVEGAWALRPDVDWELFEPDDGRRRYAAPGGPQPHRRTVLPIGSRRWEFAHLTAALGADAVVGMGGGKNTRLTLRAAAERGIPVWPIPHFGGAALESFLLMSRNTEDAVASWGDRLRILSSDPGILAGRMMLALQDPSFGKSLRRVYFLSYSHSGKQETDEMELFLRREGRRVLRDEINFRPARSLSEEARQCIAAADDVLVMDSVRSSASPWVKDEVRYAYELQERRGPEHRRVMGILLEGAPFRRAPSLGPEPARA